MHIQLDFSPEMQIPFSPGVIAPQSCYLYLSYKEPWSVNSGCAFTFPRLDLGRGYFNLYQNGDEVYSSDVEEYSEYVGVSLPEWTFQVYYLGAIDGKPCYQAVSAGFPIGANEKSALVVQDEKLIEHGDPIALFRSMGGIPEIWNGIEVLPTLKVAV